MNAFVEVYEPVLFTRIGLRYFDVIVRSNLGLEDIDREDLIAPQFLGVIASPELKANVTQFQSTSLVNLKDDQGEVRIIAGTVMSTESAETNFMIDSDFYKLKREEKDKLLNRLDYFHTKASGLFRMCIKDKLHDAMEPMQNL